MDRNRATHGCDAQGGTCLTGSDARYMTKAVAVLVQGCPLAFREHALDRMLGVSRGKECTGMLIKHADGQAEYLAELELRADGSGAGAKQAAKELSIRRAGIRGEAQAAYLINFDFEKSAHWAVIHDLRVEHSGRVAQIDHLLINRWLDVYVLETKSFSSGMKITEDGEFLRWNSYKKQFEGMASPLEQNERHIQILKDVMGGMVLPERMGIRIAPGFQSYVLVEPTARIDRPKRFDASRVIKSDQLKRTIWREIDSENPFIGMIRTAAKIVSAETVESVARQLVALHKPLRQPTEAGRGADFVVTASPVVAAADKARAAHSESMAASVYPKGRAPVHPSREQESGKMPVPADAPSCKHCQCSSGSVLYGKYGYYLRCAACEKNTALRFTCLDGHSPRLRKDRDNFYRDCADCGTSVLFFRNPNASEVK